MEKESREEEGGRKKEERTRLLVDPGDKCRCRYYLKLKLRCSLKMFNAGLDKLVASLKSKAKNMTDLKRIFGNTWAWAQNEYPRCDEEQTLNILTRKGIYPYDFINNKEKLKICTPPTRDQFHNTLYQRTITEDEYKQFLDTWKTLNCQTLGCLAKAYQVSRLSFPSSSSSFFTFSHFSTFTTFSHCSHFFTFFFQIFHIFS